MEVRNRYRTRNVVQLEKPRSRELRLSPSRANARVQSDFLNLLGLTRNLTFPEDASYMSSQKTPARSCVVVIMGSRCDICRRWFKCSYDAGLHQKKYHDETEIKILTKSLTIKNRSRLKKSRTLDKENKNKKEVFQNLNKFFSKRDFHNTNSYENEFSTNPYDKVYKTPRDSPTNKTNTNQETIKRVQESPKLTYKVPTKDQKSILSFMKPKPIEIDDDIQFCCEVKYDQNKPKIVKEDDDLEVVCHIIKDNEDKKPKPMTLQQEFIPVVSLSKNKNYDNWLVHIKKTSVINRPNVLLKTNDLRPQVYQKTNLASADALVRPKVTVNKVSSKDVKEEKFVQMGLSKYIQVKASPKDSNSVLSNRTLFSSNIYTNSIHSDTMVGKYNERPCDKNKKNIPKTQDDDPEIFILS